MNDANRQRLAALLFPQREAQTTGARTYTAASSSSGGTVDVVIGAPEYDEFGNEVISLADVTVSVPIIGRANGGDDVLVQIVDGNPIALGSAGWGDSIADYPVHRGASGIWEYVIWASGKVDMWGKTAEITASTWVRWGTTTIYYAEIGGDAYPTDGGGNSIFATAPRVIPGWARSSNDAWWSYAEGDATTAPLVYIYRPVSTSSAKGYLTYHAHGTVNPSFTY